MRLGAAYPAASGSSYTGAPERFSASRIPALTLRLRSLNSQTWPTTGEDASTLPFALTTLTANRVGSQAVGTGDDCAPWSRSGDCDFLVERPGSSRQRRRRKRSAAKAARQPIPARGQANHVFLLDQIESDASIAADLAHRPVPTSVSAHHLLILVAKLSGRNRRTAVAEQAEQVCGHSQCRYCHQSGGGGGGDDENKSTRPAMPDRTLQLATQRLSTQSEGLGARRRAAEQATPP